MYRNLKDCRGTCSGSAYPHFPSGSETPSSRSDSPGQNTDPARYSIGIELSLTASSIAISLLWSVSPLISKQLLKCTLDHSPDRPPAGSHPHTGKIQTNLILYSCPFVIQPVILQTPSCSAAPPGYKDHNPQSAATGPLVSDPSHTDGQTESEGRIICGMVLDQVIGKLVAETQSRLS